MPLDFKKADLTAVIDQVTQDLRAVLRFFPEQAANPRIDFAIGVIEARAKQIRGLPTWPLYYDEAQQAYDIISELEREVSNLANDRFGLAVTQAAEPLRRFVEEHAFLTSEGRRFAAKHSGQPSCRWCHAPVGTWADDAASYESWLDAECQRCHRTQRHAPGF